MWIAHSAEGRGGWVSIIAHRRKPEYLMVRARVPDHITSMWPKAEIYVSEGPHDYQFRADILREDVAMVLKKYAESIDYDDYKKSVSDSDLYDALVRIWSVLVQVFGRGPVY